MTRIRVTLAEAPTDVLVFLADQPHDTWWTVTGVVGHTAPEDAPDAHRTAVHALELLRDLGYVEAATVDGFPGVRATDQGRQAVVDATSAEPGASDA